MGAHRHPEVPKVTAHHEPRSDGRRRQYKTDWERQQRHARRVAADLARRARAHLRAEELDQLAGCTTHASIYPDCFDD